MADVISNFSETNRKILNQNKLIGEKVKKCIQVLKILANMDQVEAFNYQHMNVLVMCLEAMALQDLEIKLDGERPPEREGFPELNKLKETIFETCDCDFVKKFRTNVLHKGIYLPKDMALMIKEVYRNDLRKFFADLLSFFEIVDKRIQNILDEVDFEKYPVNLVNIFEPIIGEIPYKIPIRNSALCRILFKQQLTSVLKKAYENLQDELSNQNLEEVFYRLTVNAYAIIRPALGGQNENDPIALLKNQRFSYIHRFYESCVEGSKILESRQLRMLQFLRKQRFHLIKLYFALIVHEKINDADADFWTKDGGTAGEKLFKYEKSQIQDMHNLLRRRPKQNVSDQEFRDIVLTYFKVMPEIDQECAAKEREEREIQFNELDGIDRREICEEFLKFSRGEQDEVDLENRILAKGVTPKEFGSMFTSFKNPKFEFEEILNKIEQLRKDFMLCKNALTVELSKIPSYRSVNFKHYDIKNLGEKILGMFWDISIIHQIEFNELTFEKIMTDSTFLQCLLRLAKCDLKKAKNQPVQYVTSSLTGVSYFSPFIAQLILGNKLSVSISDSDLANVVEGLIRLQSTISVESLRNLILHFNESSDLERLQIVFKTFQNNITTLSCNELFKFIGLFYVQFEWKKGNPCFALNGHSTSNLDQECLGIFLKEFVANSLPGSGPDYLVAWLRIVQRAVTRWFQYEGSKITKLTEFLNTLIQSNWFRNLRFLDTGRLEILTCFATLASKQDKKRDKNKVPITLDSSTPDGRIILHESKYVLLADYVIQELTYLYNLAQELSHSCDHASARQIYEYLFETISVRCKVLQGATNSSELVERIGQLNLRKLKNRLIHTRSCDDQIYPRQISAELLCPTQDIDAFDNMIRDFRNLYDVAFIVSQLGNNHSMAFEIYKHLRDSILIRCGITALDKNSYTNLLKNSIYEKIVKELDYWDILRVMRDMAYEQIQMAESATNESEIFTAYKLAIEIYEEVIRLEDGDDSFGTKTLNPCAYACYKFCKECCVLTPDEKLIYIEKSKQYYENALRISRRIYTESHPAIKKLNKDLDMVKTYEEQINI